jgi:hypothetical protein
MINAQERISVAQPIQVHSFQVWGRKKTWGGQLLIVMASTFGAKPISTLGLKTYATKSASVEEWGEP